MGVHRAVQGLYARRLARALVRGPLPRHVAVVMDGNRRWARGQGFANPSVGHRHGAEHLEDLLGWCADLGISQVTAWVASADNIRRRDPRQVAFLMHLAATLIPQRITRQRAWRLHVIGQMDVLPHATVQALKQAQEATRDLVGAGDLTIAIGYGGRAEIVEAVRSALEDAAESGSTTAELAARIDEGDIARHLQTVGDHPDVVIRTSGEQRMSDFLLWQSARSELFFVDVDWPAFRRVDLLRVLRDYARRVGRH